MTFTRLVIRGLRYYLGVHVATALICMITTTVIVGSLVVGDSVNGTLAHRQAMRVGHVGQALQSGARFFRSALADELAQTLSGSVVAPVIQLAGIASTPDGSHAAGRVTVLGIDESFGPLAPEATGPDPLNDSEAAISSALARQLDVSVGERIILRVLRPSNLPRDTAFTRIDDLTTALSVTVTQILSDEQFGSFSLQNATMAPRNAFVSIEWMASRLDVAGHANGILIGGVDADSINADAASRALKRIWTLNDAQIETTDLANESVLQWSSPRVFLDSFVTMAAQYSGVTSVGVFSYFVNGFECNGKSASYGFVAGLGALTAGQDANESRAHLWLASTGAEGLADDEIILNRWLADDLSAGVGDHVEMSYFVIGPGSRLVEEKRTFIVHSIVPMDHPAIDDSLMPSIPGLADSENCRDWDPGIPIELDRITDRDEQYWDKYHGAPKAIISLSAAQRIWQNRFGNLTAIRVDAADAVPFIATMHDALDPAEFGLFFSPVGQPGESAKIASTDFAGLFLGLSMFLIVSGLLLTAMVFALSIEQRSREIGILSAIGYRPGRIGVLFVIQGAIVALIGAVGGLGLGLAYTRAVLAALGTIWQDAVAGTGLDFHATVPSMVYGCAGTFLIAIITMWWIVRRQVKQQISVLTSRADAVALSKSKHGPIRIDRAMTVVPMIAAVAFCAAGFLGSFASGANMGLFMAAGLALLVAGLALASSMLRLTSTANAGIESVSRLARLGASRRRSRSMACVVLLALGCFVVVLVGAFQPSSTLDDRDRTSGTGGFQLLAESTLPILTGLDQLKQDAMLPDGVSIVPMRMHAGDDASCLNLAQTRQPRLLAVNPDDRQWRGAFSFASTIESDLTSADQWQLLRGRLGPHSNDDTTPIFPAIGDAATITWALHLSIGDEIQYTDERGRPFRVRIVGALKNSLFQGSLIISEDAFHTLYPAGVGYHMLLISVPAQRDLDEIAQSLSVELADTGVEVMPTHERLAEFAAVQNTYLAIFQVLGALGLALGTIGLAFVVLRNTLERRSEFALLLAVGYTAKLIRRLVLLEHAMLVLLGIGAGALAGAVASLAGSSTGVDRASLLFSAVLALTIIVLALITIRLSVAIALRRPLIQALRTE